jgi:Domain of unknown function (DUF362)
MRGESFYDDFQDQLARWGQRWAEDPDRELLEIAFLSLEREQLVSVTYHDDLLRRRLATLPLDAETQALFRHALAFTWKDEEMHAVFVRGLLWRRGRAWLRVRANWHFVAGLLAGWATFVQQHVRWREAPFSRLFSTLTLWGGLITGTAPPSVRQHLRFHSFRDFCSFNIDAERTATLAWDRLAALGRRLGLEARTVALFERIREDEIQHQRLFALLSESLDAEDRLQPGLDADGLAARIGALHQDFLPPERRGRAQRLGAGGVVAVTEGEDRGATLEQSLDRSGLAEEIDRAVGESGLSLDQVEVAVKLSFMLGLQRGDLSPMVHPDTVAGLVAWLQARGLRRICLIEAPTHYDRLLGGRSVAEVARWFGFAGEPELIDASADQVPAEHPRGMAPDTVCRRWASAHLRLVVGKLRSHPVHLVSLGLCALEGLGARADQFHFADRDAAPEVGTVTLAERFPPHFSLLDGWSDAPDGVAGVLGARRPRQPRRYYAGRDALAVDLVAARHLGLADPFGSTYLRTAIHWFGDPRPTTRVVGTDGPVTGWRAPYRHGFATGMRFLAAFVYAHASGRGALFLPAADLDAFPPLQAAGPALRVGRALVRRLFELPERAGP